MTCAPFDRLVAYWLGEGDDLLEEHVFACDLCAGRLESLAALDRGVVALVRRGGLRAVIPAPLVDDLARGGLRLRHYRLAPGERVACGIGPDEHFVVTQLEVDLAGVERVDLVIRRPDVRDRLVDVPFDRAAGRVIVASSGDVIRKLPDVVLELELIDTTGAVERPLGAYTLVHSATPR